MYTYYKSGMKWDIEGNTSFYPWSELEFMRVEKDREWVMPPFKSKNKFFIWLHTKMAVEELVPTGKWNLRVEFRKHRCLIECDTKEDAVDEMHEIMKILDGEEESGTED